MKPRAKACLLTIALVAGALCVRSSAGFAAESRSGSTTRRTTPSSRRAPAKKKRKTPARPPAKKPVSKPAPSPVPEVPREAPAEAPAPAPPPPPPVPAEAPRPVEEGGVVSEVNPPSRSGCGAGVATFALGVEGTAVARLFDTTGDVQRERTLARPGVGVDVELFPFCGDEGGLDRVGLFGSFVGERGIGVVDAGRRRTERGNAAGERFSAGLRLVLFRGQSASVLASVGIEGHRYQLDQPSPPLDPSVCPTTSLELCTPDTRSLRPAAGLDARFRLSERFTLLLAGSGSFTNVGRGQPGTLTAEAAARLIGVWAGLRLRARLWHGLTVQSTAQATTLFYGYDDPAIPYRIAREVYPSVGLGLAWVSQR